MASRKKATKISEKKTIRVELSPFIRSFLSQYSLHIFIFLIALFLIITFSNPGLFLNDEWITVNQVHQLDLGHQIIYNEGKYGTFANGTPGPYFMARGNLLMYTAMLPVISMPALGFFRFFGENFRAAILLIWTIIPILIILLLGIFFTKYAKIGKTRIIIPLTLIMLIFLLISLLLYHPFVFLNVTAPREVAAVVFTNHVLFALTAVLVYSTCKTICYKTGTAIFGTIAILASSSLIFWAANAKDHMLVACCFALVVYFFVDYLTHQRFFTAVFGFICLGLLTWARPEVGFFTFLICTVYYLIFQVYLLKKESINGITLGKNTLAILFTGIGVLPLLINNAAVTGNPFTPTFLVTRIAPTSSIDVSSIISSHISSGLIQTGTSPGYMAGGVFSTLANYFSIQWRTLIPDLFGVLVNPASGNMSFLAVCPLALFALVLPFLHLSGKKRMSLDETLIPLFLFIMGVAVFVAYLPSLHTMNTDGGIVPDIRYLTPVYIPAGLLGVMGITSLYKKFSGKLMVVRLVASVLIITPVFLLSLMILQPFGGYYSGYTLFFKSCIALTLALCLGTLIFSKSRQKMMIFSWLLVILLAIPFAWQVMMLFLYSVGKFNGYPFWIPLVEHFYNSVIQVNYTPP